MAITLNTNLPSLLAQHQLSLHTKALAQSSQQLASGSLLNSGNLDAATFAISAFFNSQVAGANQAASNANDGVAITQVAGSALGQTSNTLIQMQQLAIQAANGSYNPGDLANIQQEMTQLGQQVDQTASQTQYNGQNLLDGSFQGQTFQVGAQAGQTVQLSIAGASTTDLGLNGISVASQGQAQNAITSLNAALNSVGTMSASLGSYQNQFASIASTQTVASIHTSAAGSRITDTDMAAAASQQAQNNILQRFNIAILAQANLQPSIAAQLIG